MHINQNWFNYNSFFRCQSNTSFILKFDHSQYIPNKYYKEQNRWRTKKAKRQWHMQCHRATFFIWGVILDIKSNKLLVHLHIYPVSLFVCISWTFKYFVLVYWIYFVICSVGAINSIICILFQRVSDKNIAAECHASFNWNFNFKIAVYKGRFFIQYFINNTR